MSKQTRPSVERRRIVIWHREGLTTVAAAALALLFNERALVWVLAFVAFANLSVAILAERDATAWYRVWKLRRDDFDNFVARTATKEGP